MLYEVITNDLYFKIKKTIQDLGFDVEKEIVEIPIDNNPPKQYSKNKFTSVVKQLGTQEQKILDEYKSLLDLRRLSPLTKEVYSLFFAIFLNDNQGSDFVELSYKQLYQYIKTQSEKLGNTQLKQCISYNFV